MHCRLCSSNRLYKFLDLGFTPPADQFLRGEQLNEPVVHYPLEVFICESCGFAQLGYVVSPEILYRYDYPYESSTTTTGKIHFHAFAASVADEFILAENDLAVDIGSNVGVLLEGFKLKGLKVLGIDPATNIVRIAEKRGIETWNEFFSTKVAKKIKDQKGLASVITATNVFAHINDLQSFMVAIKYLLNDKGVLIIEAPHFLNLIQNLEYDTIYHEHLSYISVEPLVPFFKKYGIRCFSKSNSNRFGIFGSWFGYRYDRFSCHGGYRTQS